MSSTAVRARRWSLPRKAGDTIDHTKGKQMALKLKYKTKEEVPAEMQALYVERDGELALDVEGVVEKAKHDEFRNANIALKKELEEQKKRFEGIDPEEVRKLAEEKRQLEETQQLKLGE